MIDGNNNPVYKTAKDILLFLQIYSALLMHISCYKPRRGFRIGFVLELSTGAQ